MRNNINMEQIIIPNVMYWKIPVFIQYQYSETHVIYFELINFYSVHIKVSKMIITVDLKITRTLYYHKMTRLFKYANAIKNEFKIFK